MFCPQLFAHSPSPLAVPHAHLLPYYLHASWSQHEFWQPPMIISTIARHPFVKLQKHDYCTIYVLPRSECLFSPSLVPYGHCFHWYGSSFDDLRCTLHNHELGAKPHAHNRFRHSLRILPKIRLLFCDFSSIIYFASRIGFFAPIIHLQIRVPLRFHFSFLPFPALYIIVGERRHCYTNEKNAAKLLRHHSGLSLSMSRLYPSKLQPTSLQHSVRGPPLLQNLALRRPSSHINSAPTHSSDAQ